MLRKSNEKFYLNFVFFFFGFVEKFLFGDLYFLLGFDVGLNVLIGLFNVL